jgi:hypothetical protein
MKTVLKIAVVLLTVVGTAALVHAQGTAFTYQGRLNANGIPANGGDGAFEVDPNFRIVELRRAGSDVALSLMTALGRNYRAEYTNNPASGTWTTFTNNVPGNGWSPGSQTTAARISLDAFIAARLCRETF